MWLTIELMTLDIYGMGYGTLAERVVERANVIHGGGTPFSHSVNFG